MVPWFVAVGLVGFTQNRKRKCALLSCTISYCLLTMSALPSCIRYRKEETGFILSPPKTVNGEVALSPSGVCFRLYSPLFKQNIADLSNLWNCHHQRLLW